MSVVSDAICCRIAAIVSGVDGEASSGRRIVMFSSLSVGVPASSAASSASGTAIGHGPFNIMFRSALRQLPFAIPAFMALRRFFTAFATVPLSLSESPFICPTMARTMDKISPSLSLCFVPIGALPRTGVLPRPISNFLLQSTLRRSAILCLRPSLDFVREGVSKIWRGCLKAVRQLEIEPCPRLITRVIVFDAPAKIHFLMSLSMTTPLLGLTGV